MIRIESLEIELGEFHLREISLEVASGEYLVLLGPTGAGKTVLLECLAGFHRPRRGRLLLEGVDVTRLQPEERGLGYVPQDYALFPNLSVHENLAYGLRARRRPRAEIEERVGAMLARLGIGHLRDRMPLNLSGGERQRTALGRALVTDPSVLLLDEPLSALDESLRSELARALRRLQQDLGRSFLHVCHSLEEASEVADRIAILHEGRIAQVGSLEELLRRPADLFVARFTGTRNLLEGVAEEAGSGSRVRIGEGIVLRSDERRGGPVAVAIRPEAIELVPGEPAGEDLVHGRLTALRLRPGGLELELELEPGLSLVARTPRRELGVGQELSFRIAPAAVLLFPREPPSSR
jgi:ABC-type Fe3+/spermidine/putrescine transport system ATPase subunit